MLTRAGRVNSPSKIQWNDIAFEALPEHVAARALFPRVSLSQSHDVHSMISRRFNPDFNLQTAYRFQFTHGITRRVRWFTGNKIGEALYAEKCPRTT